MDNKYFTYIFLLMFFTLVFTGCSCNSCKCKEELKTDLRADDIKEEIDLEVLPKMGQ